MSARLYGLFLVDIWHCDGLVVAHFWQTEAERRSAISPCQAWDRYGTEEFCYLGRHW